MFLTIVFFFQRSKVLSTGSAVAGESSATQDQRPADTNKSHQLKLVPPMPSGLISAGKQKNTKKSSRSTLEGGGGSGSKSSSNSYAKKRSRAVPSIYQVLVDVTDMYAVGLAVNK